MYHCTPSQLVVASVLRSLKKQLLTHTRVQTGWQASSSSVTILDHKHTHTHTHTHTRHTPEFFTPSWKQLMGPASSRTSGMVTVDDGSVFVSGLSVLWAALPNNFSLICLLTYDVISASSSTLGTTASPQTASPQTASHWVSCDDAGCVCDSTHRQHHHSAKMWC